jgi:hypothetical protein
LVFLVAVHSSTLVNGFFSFHVIHANCYNIHARPYAWLLQISWPVWSPGGSRRRELHVLVSYWHTHSDHDRFHRHTLKRNHREWRLVCDNGRRSPRVYSELGRWGFRKSFCCCRNRLILKLEFQLPQLAPSTIPQSNTPQFSSSNPNSHLHRQMTYICCCKLHLLHVVKVLVI